MPSDGRHLFALILWWAVPLRPERKRRSHKSNPYDTGLIPLGRSEPVETWPDAQSAPVKVNFLWLSVSLTQVTVQRLCLCCFQSSRCVAADINQWIFLLLRLVTVKNLQPDVTFPKIWQTHEPEREGECVCVCVCVCVPRGHDRRRMVWSQAERTAEQRVVHDMKPMNTHQQTDWSDCDLLFRWSCIFPAAPLVECRYTSATDLHLRGIIFA